MSKKRFKDGLNDVFSEETQFEPNIDNSPWLLETSTEQSVKQENQRTTKPKRRRGKSFTSDLESLFASTSAAIERGTETSRTDDVNARSRNRPRRRIQTLTGLDSLIRDTTNGNVQRPPSEEEHNGLKKRVTFTYDRDQFFKLKKIARLEGAYLKDIISNLLDGYIQKFETENSL